MIDNGRAIIHLDLDAFFAAVEVLEKPDLEGKPVLVGGRSGRGVVAAASYPAREFGIRSAMPMFRALQLCPKAIVVPPRHRLYSAYSRRVMDILRETSDLMEQMSIDEACLDLSEQVDQWDDAVDIARSIQQRVRDEVHLSASLGVATNKLVAKIASDQDKPAGLTIVRPGQEAAFLAPLPVRVLWGVGPVTAVKLEEMGVSLVGELAQIPVELLTSSFGNHGRAMARQALGIDRRPVSTERQIKSASHERTFSRDLTDLAALKEELKKMSRGVERRLNRYGLAAGTVAIKIRYSDFTTLVRQMHLTVPVDDAESIYQVGEVLLERTWVGGEPVRLLGIAGRNLLPPSGQLTLF